MSEKRFICGLGFPINSDDPIRIITDKETNKDYFKFSDICEIMNEQQVTIQRFEEYVFSDERILCYNCLFCQEKDIYEVKCEIKGSVDVHGICQYYEKKR